MAVNDEVEARTKAWEAFKSLVGEKEARKDLTLSAFVFAWDAAMASRATPTNTKKSVNERFVSAMNKSNLASPGPWHVWGLDDQGGYQILGPSGNVVAEHAIEEDAIFIAAARTNLNEFRWALEDVAKVVSIGEDLLAHGALMASDGEEILQQLRNILDNRIGTEDNP